MDIKNTNKYEYFLFRMQKNRFSYLISLAVRATGDSAYYYRQYRHHRQPQCRQHHYLEHRFPTSRGHFKVSKHFKTFANEMTLLAM